MNAFHLLLLMNCQKLTFAGETLKEAHFETISEAVERASSALVSLEFEWYVA